MWYKLAINPISISGVFGLDVPSLNNAIIKKMVFNDNGPMVEIYFDVENYPSSPPVKWITNGYNKAQIWIKLIDVTSIKVEGWSQNNLVDIKLKEIEQTLFFLSIKGDDCSIEVSFKYFDAGATGYINRSTSLY
jgi:hypothetical protein